MRILIIENEQKVTCLLKSVLTANAYLVDATANGLHGYQLAQSIKYDCIILNISLPKVDGLELCRRLRSEGKTTPILMLTAKDTIDERVNGLNAGADDLMSKPFAVPELLARLRALQRWNR